jgi:Tol biopolymer transport system component
MSTATPAGNKPRRTWLIVLAVVAALALAQQGPMLPGGRIVYSSDKTGDFEIYVMDTGGRNVTQLTHTLGDDYEPEWSPDGKQIAFTSNRSGNWEIYLINADGSTPRNLTKNGAMDVGPVFSRACSGLAQPCVTWIAFFSDRDGDFNLYMMDEQGGNVTQLTDDPADDWWPSWSPDGRQVAFMSARDGWRTDIFVLDVGSGTVRQYTNTPYDDELWPVWSPDGKRIAFVSDRDGWYHLYVMDADCDPECGANPQPVTDRKMATDIDPNWSPDGRWLVFASDCDPTVEYGFQYDFELFAVRADGKGLTQLTFNDWVDDFTPAWTR